MKKIVILKKYTFSSNYQNNNYIKFIRLKNNLIFFFKLNLFLYFIYLIILEYLKKKNEIFYNIKKTQIKRNIKIYKLNLFKIKYKDFIKELPNYNHTHLISNKIFWCWLQGKNKLPNISKACLNSILKNCKSHEIIFIDDNNINQYVHFPSFIVKKYKNKKLSKAHFSDLVRLELLIKYGGTWIDSTVLITKYKNIFFKKDLFFFQNTNRIFYAGSNWFITAEKENPILKTTRDLLYEFWSKNNQIFDYFLFHFLLKLACDKYYKDFKNIPSYFNSAPHMLQFELFRPFNKSKYEYILNISSIHKLTRKKKINITKGLVYNHILQEFNAT